ncbi:MAG TPA: metal ABC transporter permease [Actinocrinis sp.]|nr:metal ABC transporter permease [Actinocrinis sp.]
MATDALVGSPFSWNLVTDFQYMWSYPFMVNAFRAGTLIAVAGALVGYFVVVRRQTFAAHSLAMISFPGASGALLLGVSTTLGALGFCMAGALLLAAANRGGRSGLAGDSAATGTLQACALALGYLFANLYHGFSGGITNLLFGQITGITSAQVAELAAGTVAVAAALAVIGRPLLLASVDPMTARAAGVPVRGLDSLFLVLVGVAVAQAGQITGALLVFSLVVLPAATAQQVTTRPGWALAVSVVIGFVATWVGLIFSYYTPYPPGPAITTLAFALYVVVRVVKQVRRRSGGAGLVVAAAADGGSGGLGGTGASGASGQLAVSGGPGSGSGSGPGSGSGSGLSSAPGSGSGSVASGGSGADLPAGELSGRASGATSGTADH